MHWSYRNPYKRGLQMRRKGSSAGRSSHLISPTQFLRFLLFKLARNVYVALRLRSPESYSIWFFPSLFVQSYRRACLLDICCLPAGFRRSDAQDPSDFLLLPSPQASPDHLETANPFGYHGCQVANSYICDPARPNIIINCRINGHRIIQCPVEG